MNETIKKLIRQARDIVSEAKDAVEANLSDMDSAIESEVEDIVRDWEVELNTDEILDGVADKIKSAAQEWLDDRLSDARSDVSSSYASDHYDGPTLDDTLEQIQKVIEKAAKAGDGGGGDFPAEDAKVLMDLTRRIEKATATADALSTTAADLRLEIADIGTTLAGALKQDRDEPEG